MVNVKALTDRFRCGPSAVREALCQLAANGLVIAEDQRGFRVAPVSEDDLLDVTQARAKIEVIAIRDAIACGDLEWEAHLVGAFHRLVRTPKFGAGYSEQHRAFHDLLVAPCRSAWMKQFRGMLHDHSERYQKLAGIHNPQGRNIDSEHRALLEAVIDRDVDRAAALISAHIEETAAILIRNGVTTPEGDVEC